MVYKYLNDLVQQDDIPKRPRPVVRPTKMLGRFCKLLPAAALLGLLACGNADAKMLSKADMQAKQSAAAERLATMSSNARGSGGTAVKNITFTNPRASGRHVVLLCCNVTDNVTEFYVDGKNIPEVDFDIGPSWAGLLPISDAANETRKVQILISRFSSPRHTSLTHAFR